VTPIELIVMDVDGTLTDGRIYYTSSGEEVKAFDVADGLGVASWTRMGRKAAIITGRESRMVSRRARDLGVEYVFQGEKRKADRLMSLLDELGLGRENCAVIGDDLNDYGMLKMAGISFAPAGASATISDMVDVTLKKRGGEGAVREMVEYLIKREGLESEFDRLWSIG